MKKVKDIMTCRCSKCNNERKFKSFKTYTLGQKLKLWCLNCMDFKEFIIKAIER